MWIARLKILQGGFKDIAGVNHLFHSTNFYLKLVNWSHQSYFFYSIMSFYESFWEIKGQNLNASVNYTANIYSEITAEMGHM